MQDQGGTVTSDMRHQEPAALWSDLVTRLAQCFKSVQPHSEDNLMPSIMHALLTSLTSWSCSHNQKPFYFFNVLRAHLHFCDGMSCSRVPGQEQGSMIRHAGLHLPA